VIFHLPDDYFSRYVPSVTSVTAADVQRVARSYVVPGKSAVVVVGDRKTIEPGIRALNPGPIKSMTIDELFQ
jgi:zinc protease